MSYSKVVGRGTFYREQTFTQLTSAGATESVDVDGLEFHTFQVTPVGVSVIIIEGSNDGTNYFTLPIAHAGTTNWIEGAGNSFANLADETFILNAIAKVKHIRLRGSTVPTTVDSKYLGTN